MNWIAKVFTRSRVYDELSREIQQHLREKVDDLVNEGMSRERAEAAARSEFGNVAAIEEQARDAWGWRWLEDFFSDVRYALRQLVRNRLVAVAAVVTLALGIGGTTAIFTAVNAVLLRPLPFKDSDRLILVSESRPGNVSKTGSPLTRYQTRAIQNTVFEETGGYWDVSGGNGMVFGSSESVERLQFSIVTGSFFSILGVQPAIGRTFSQSEELPGGAKVFLASDALWHRLLGGDPRAVGQSFRLDGEPYILIGILPPDFHFPAACDVWMPLGTLGTWPLRDRVSHQFWMLGRLRHGTTIRQAQVQLEVVQQGLALAYPATDADWHVTVTPLLEEFVGNVRTSLWVLFAAVAFMLLIACTNVVNLLLSRAVAREKEFAVRAALGAGRLRLLRQAFSEVLLIVVAGTAIALLLAKVGLKMIVALSAGSIPRFEQPQLAGAVPAFCAGLALLITFFVGLAPGFYASRIGFATSLQAGQRTAALSRRSRGLRNLLIIFEVALTTLLLAGSGLMLRSFQRLREVDVGFRPEDLVSMKIALPDALYPKPEQRSAFLQVLLERLNSTPGIATAAATDRLPLSGERNWGSFNIVGRPLLDSAHAPSVEGRAVSANYFQTVGIPLLRGRPFRDADVTQNHPVVIINQAMVQKFWSGADPIGQRIVSPYRPTDPPREVIGVVGNVKDFAVDEESPPEMYSTVRWWNEMNLVLLTKLDLASLTAAVRSQVMSVDRNVPVYGVGKMEDLVSHSIARQRFELVLLALFAFVALLLAAVGIYGVLAFAVSCRTQEVGVRLALGATRGSAMRLVLWHGMRLVLLGLMGGGVASFILVRLIRGLLFQVSPSDPLSFGGVIVVLLFAGALACLVPARRAMRIDPMIALRSE